MRDPSEFGAGALPGARNIPFGALKEHVAELKSLEVPLVLYCPKGGRARTAHGMLSQRGGYRLHTLGGIDRWWELAHDFPSFSVKAQGRECDANEHLAARIGLP